MAEAEDGLEEMVVVFGVVSRRRFGALECRAGPPPEARLPGVRTLATPRVKILMKVREGGGDGRRKRRDMVEAVVVEIGEIR